MVKKDLKFNIKNTQIAEAINLGRLKEKLASKGVESKEEKKTDISPKKKKLLEPIKESSKEAEEVKGEATKRKARTRSVFAEQKEELAERTIEVEEEKPLSGKPNPLTLEPVEEVFPEAAPSPIEKKTEVKVPPQPEGKQLLGPTGKHIKDLLPPKIQKPKEESETVPTPAVDEKKTVKKEKGRKEEETKEPPPKKGVKTGRFKEFQDIKPTHRQQQPGRFDARDRQGLRDTDDDSRWRKKRSQKLQDVQEDTTVRPTALSIRVPISIKDLAQEMKLKASQLISKLFLQGMVATINDLLEDETTIQLLGEEFGCAIAIDTSEEERIQITGKSVREEIKEAPPENLSIRPPVVAFMGHVDHGKTSLIDYIRKSSIALGEAGAITQHIGAFLSKTAVGDIAILDTPGHEAFSAMRARGADVTDIVVLVVAGDEGMRAQTEEAIQHAQAAGVTIVVAVNKCDKPNFNLDIVYRQLADHNLLPEPWGGQTIAVKCSAVTGEGVKELLEMLALQAEVLELKANPLARARGTVLESEMHKGLGATATVLVQNGTLKLGDPLVFGESWGRVKTMRDEFGNFLAHAIPSTPVEITGLSGLPQAGEEFIVVSSEKEAREIAEARLIGKRQLYLQQSRKKSIENLFQQASDKVKKALKVVLRADVQGSLEALKASLLKIESEKVDIEIIATGIGEISESDVLLAAASNAIIVGFHTQVESHAESLLKQHGVHLALHDIIYHAIDDVKVLMTGLLEKISQETEKGKAEVRAVFKASHLGKIAGCIVTEGSIHRNHHIRVVREGTLIWKGSISSIKRVQEDAREVQKGVECGIVLSNFNDVQVGDILEAFEITYITQTL